MMSWTIELDRKIYEMVTAFNGTVTDALEHVAKEFDTSVYTIRNRWYHPNIKAMRDEASGKEVVVQEKAIIKKESVAVEIPNVQAAIELLHQAVADELAQLRSQVENLQQMNGKLINDCGKLQERNSELEQEYSVLQRVITVARDIVVKEQLGDKPVTHLKMERNGNLETVAI